MQKSCYNSFISLVRPAGFEEVTLQRAVRNIESLPTRIQNRVLARIENMSHNLKGDVKRLTDFTPEYRLRVGDYGVLFEIEGKAIVIYRVMCKKRSVLWL